MLSKNQIKFINSLKQKKSRIANKLFVVEGKKMIDELLKSDYTIHSIYSTFQPKEVLFDSSTVPYVNITENELKKISQLTTPNEILALVYFKKPEIKNINFENELIIALDNIRDPGNLGTIVRVADWFGIKTIICSENSVDVYNSKTVQASMGSVFRVDVFYSDLKSQIEFGLRNKIPVYAAVLDGDSVYNFKKTKNGFIVFGSESHGISEQLLSIKGVQKITIPSVGEAESLNVAVATAIVCSEFKRTTFG